MHFAVEHTFPAPRLRVADLLCDPSFHTHLELPDLGLPVVVKCAATSASRFLCLRYEYVGHIDAIARKVVGGSRLVWIQELRLNTVTYQGTLSFQAEHDTRLSGAAEVTIVDVDGTSSRRRIEGDLHVKIPLLGGTAEKRILPGIVRRLHAEAEALSRQVTLRAS